MHLQGLRAKRGVLCEFNDEPEEALYITKSPNARLKSRPGCLVYWQLQYRLQ